MSKSCSRCEKEASIHMYGYLVCQDCEPKLGLLTDETIKKHLSRNPSFEKEVGEKLAKLEEIYTRRKIKLLHIKDRLRHL